MLTDKRAFSELMSYADLSIKDQDKSLVEIIGKDPIVDSPFLAGEAVASAIAAQSAAVSEIWQLKTGRHQNIRISMKAALNSITGLDNIYQYGHHIETGFQNEPTMGFYPTRDSKWIFILGLFPSLRDGLLTLLNCAHSKTAIGESIAKWNAQELEDTLAEYGLSGGMLRTEDEWRAHPQGKSLSKLPVVDIVKIGKSESELNINDKKRPLSGIRVIDLTRVLAGPMASRLLAEQGADVMHISSPNLPYLLSALLETGMGKKSAYIDLDKPKDVESIKGLISKSDIFCENYHRSGLSKHGLSPLELAKLKPGIIYVSESTYGEVGPWQYRRGAEQLAESVTGMSAELGAIDSPKTFPGYLNDYLTGYLAAFGACAALIRRAKEGGSYWVRVSLCRSAMWVQDLGRVSSSDIVNPITCEERESFMIESDSPFGKIKHVGPVAKYSETPSYYDIPVVPLGAHQPIW